MAFLQKWTVRRGGEVSGERERRVSGVIKIQTVLGEKKKRKEKEKIEVSIPPNAKVLCTSFNFD